MSRPAVEELVRVPDTLMRWQPAEKNESQAGVAWLFTVPVPLTELPL